MSTRFRIIEHIAPCSHTREYPAATSNGDADKPKIAVKQYIPLSNPVPSPGDVTIIGAHANGFPKVNGFPSERMKMADSKFRRCMSLYGRSWKREADHLISRYVQYGQRMFGIRDNRVF